MSLLCHCLSTYKTYFRLQVASHLGFVLWLAWTILTCEFCSVIAVNCPYMWVLFCDCHELSLHVSSVLWLLWTVLTCESCSVIAVNCPYMWVLFCDWHELSLHVSSVLWLLWTVLTCEFCSVIAVNCPYMWVLWLLSVWKRQKPLYMIQYGTLTVSVQSLIVHSLRGECKNVLSSSFNDT